MKKSKPNWPQGGLKLSPKTHRKKPRKGFGKVLDILTGGIRVTRRVTRTTEFIINRPKDKPK